MPTKDQITALIERAALVSVTYAVSKGWIDVKMASDLGPLVIGILSLAYAWWINRPQAIVQSAAALPDTTVVTSPELANSTPEKNIVSTATNSVELR
jgi:hypothetical protein